jgi:hypothetical protein
MESAPNSEGRTAFERLAEDIVPSFGDEKDKPEPTVASVKDTDLGNGSHVSDIEDYD